MNEQNMFYIKILSPVHIGCDEVYEPSGFVVNEEAETLTAFDPLDFFRNLDAQTKERYAAICGKGSIESIAEFYKFMRNRQFEGSSVKVKLSKEFVNHYRESMGKNIRDFQKELNQFSIARTSFNPITQKPYIPGTTVKGALRTACLNELAKSKTITLDRNDKKRAETLEKKLLDYQTLEKDPFRLLKVSDFHPVGLCSTKIVYAVNEKKKDSSRFQARGPYQLQEIIEPGAVFTGTIQVLEPLAREAIKNPLKNEEVIGNAKIFYAKEMNRENDELTTAGIETFSATDGNDPCLLRLGRHSGAESITIDGYRNIKIMKQKGAKDYADKSTTFWLASNASTGYRKNNLLPFGWVALGVLTGELRKNIEQMQAAEPAETKSGIAETKITIPRKVKTAPPLEEIWENVFVVYDAGGAGRITAKSPEGKNAILHGKANRENLKAATSDSLHKKLFEGKKQVSKANVKVLKIGNGFEIVRVEQAK